MFGWFKKNKKEPQKIIYRDKADLFELPPIPEELHQQFRNLQTETSGYMSEPLRVLKSMYQYMDSYNKFISSFSVCQRGCNHCCKNDVYITSLEAEYIAQGVNAAPNSIPENKEMGKVLCPFLGESGECKVYEFRPFNCRTFHTLDDPKYCETDEDHMIYGSAGHGYGSSILSKIHDAIKQLNGKHKSDDIRAFFSKRS